MISDIHERRLGEAVAELEKLGKACRSADAGSAT